MRKLNIDTVESLEIEGQTETAPSAVTGPSAVSSNAFPPATAFYDCDYGYYYYHGRNSRTRNQAPLS